MSLQAILAATKAASATRVPQDKQAIMHRATDDLRRSGILDRIVPVGGAAPGFSLVGHDDQMISSAELLARGPMVVSFFRGSW